MFLWVEKREKYAKMATVRSKSEQPLENKPITGTLMTNKHEPQLASDTIVNRNAEVGVHGSNVQGTTDPDVPSLSANENSSPHGTAVSTRNKDASGLSCNSTSPTVGENRTDVDFQNNNGKVVSAEPGENRNIEQDTEREKFEKTPENSSSMDTIEELASASKEMHFHGEAPQGTETEIKETGDPNCMAKDKHNKEERSGETESKKSGNTVIAKRRKSCLECIECGKTFTRRETYNLHRYSHMHQDEEASLACKECDITFHHRSDLIKHRSTHKEESQTKTVANVSQSELIHKRRKSSIKLYKKQRKFECEHCSMCFSTKIRLSLHACKHNVEKPFRCPLCRREFQYRVSINAHMQSHSLDSPYRCLECNKGFQNVEKMHIHQRSHAALKPYECPDCNMVFRHRYIMEDHRRRHTEERPHECKICCKNFKYSSLLQQHQYLHTGRKPYHCSYCGKRFAFAQNMRIHCRQHRKISASSEAHIANHNVSCDGDVREVSKENTNHHSEEQRNCPLCPQLFYKAADLRAHMLIHEAEYERMTNGKRFEKVYVCPYCPLKFPTESTLQCHTQTHLTNVLGVNTSHITNHVNAVPEMKEAVCMDKADIDSISGGGEPGDQTEKKPFRCRDCGKCFRYRSVLELHMRIHNKGYQCPVCKKTFRFSSYLQQHSIIHTGKKPYKCPDCGKDFAFHHNMKTHQRLHQQKPFRCTQCRKGYSDESQLQRHMLSHTGEKPYKCHLCDKSFALAYLLRDHLNTHTGERPHRCQECHKSFPWLSSLLVHQKIHVRKRQGQSHSYAMSTHSQRGRVKEFASSGRRGRPRLDRDNDRTTQPCQIIQETIMPNVVLQQLHSFDADRHERMQPRSQHLLTNNHSQTVQLQQEWQLQIPPTELLHSQKTLLESQPTDVQLQWPGNHKTVSAQPSLAANYYGEIKMSGNESEQKAKHPSLWVNAPNSNQQNTSPESPCHMDRSSSMDVKTQLPRSRSQSSPNQLINIQDPQQSQRSALCDSVQTNKPELFSNLTEDGRETMNMDAPVSNESDKLTHTIKEDLQIQNSTGMTKTGLTEMDPSEGGMLTTSASILQNSNPWGLKASFEMSTTVGLQEIPGEALEKHQNRLIHHLPQQPSQHMQLLQQLHQPQLQQQTQVPPTWVTASPLNQIGLVNMSYTSAHFPLGDRPPMWGIQTSPVVSQALLNGPVQQGHVRAPQHVALISGRQIPLTQPSSFISPPFPPPTLNLSAPHPIHTVGRQQPGPIPQGIFFTSKGTINEIPVMPQITNLPQLSQQTEPHKTGNKMPFPPDHLFQCMICGCSLPGDLELQMHYVQHAQRDV